MASREEPKPKNWLSRILSRIKRKIKRCDTRNSPSASTEQSSSHQQPTSQPPPPAYSLIDENAAVSNLPAAASSSSNPPVEDKLRELLQRFDYMGVSTRLWLPQYPSSLYVALAWAAEHGFESMIHELIGLGARLLPTPADMEDYHSVTADRHSRDSPLHAALKSWMGCRIPIFEFMIKSFQTQIVSDPRGKADQARLIGWRDAAGLTPFALAARYSDRGIVELLLDMGSLLEGRDNEGQTPLHYATKAWSDYYSDKIVSLLLDKGATVECQDNKGFTPLHTAAQNFKSWKIIPILLDRGASIDCRDNTGCTPLHLASQNAACVKLVALLLDRGASIDCRNNDGRTPLHLASQDASCHKTVALLLDRGASIDCLDIEGRTPLHYSSGLSEEELIKRGADTAICDNAGFSPPEISKNRNGEWIGTKRPEIVEPTQEAQSLEPKVESKIESQKLKKVPSDPFFGTAEAEILRWD